MQEVQCGLDVSAKHDFSRSFPSSGKGSTAVAQQKDTAVFFSAPLAFRITVLKVCTNFSASPLELGWYGAISVHLIPLPMQNCLNSSAMNRGPLL